MDSLLISSESTVKKIENLLSLTAFGAGIPINPEIFSTVFSCWQKRHILFISYSRAKDGKTADLIVEPQVLSFFEGCWYLKVKVRKTSNPTFAPVPVIALALHRIKQAKELLEQFCDDSKIIKTAADGDIFEFPKIKKLTVKVHGKGYRFAIERFQHDILKNFDNDSALLAIYDIEEYRAFNLVFTWPEDIEVVLPRSFRKKIYMAAQFVMEQHMSVTPQTVTKKQRI